MENVNQFDDIMNGLRAERVIDQRRADWIRVNAAALVLTTVLAATANTHVQTYLQESEAVQTTIDPVRKSVDWIYENALNGDIKEDPQLPTGAELGSDTTGIRQGSPIDVSRLYSPWSPDNIAART